MNEDSREQGHAVRSGPLPKTAQRALVAAAADSYRLSNLRFQAGVDTFINALDAHLLVAMHGGHPGVVMNVAHTFSLMGAS